MAEVQLLGMTHYPPFGWTNDSMAGVMRLILSDPGIPQEQKDSKNWPEAMRAEWGDDEGRESAPLHRAELVAGLDQIREEIESFNPDLILVWGDDQYENFKEDLIPPFSVLAYPDRIVHPYQSKLARMFPNYWGESEDFAVEVKGGPKVAKLLVTKLIERGFDVPYAYTPLHDTELPHAFLNTVLFLDHRREGFPWPLICMPINCYGRTVVAAEGLWKPFGEKLDFDPPSPSPWRLMDLGAAVAQILRESGLRVSIVASSSWSHAFLTDHTWRLRPDTDADRKFYDALVTSDYSTWRQTTTEQIQYAGQQEVLNWFALMGAAQELGVKPIWSSFVETWIFNSNKVFAAWSPSASA